MLGIARNGWRRDDVVRMNQRNCGGWTIVRLRFTTPAAPRMWRSGEKYCGARRSSRFRAHRVFHGRKSGSELAGEWAVRVQRNFVELRRFVRQ